MVVVAAAAAAVVVVVVVKTCTVSFTKFRGQTFQ